MIALVTATKGRIAIDTDDMSEISWNSDILAARLIDPYLDPYWTLNPDIADKFELETIPAELSPELLIWFNTQDTFFVACDMLEYYRVKNHINKKTVLKVLEEKISEHGAMWTLNQYYMEAFGYQFVV